MLATTYSHHDAGAQVRRAQAHDIDEHTELLEGWNLHYEQLDRGRFESRFDDARWPGAQLFQENTTRRVRQRGVLSPASLGIATFIEGQGALLVNGQRCEIGAMLACDTGEIDLCTPPDCTLVGVVVDAQELRDAAEHTPPLQRLLRPGLLSAVRPTAAALAAWRATLASAFTALEQPPGQRPCGAALHQLHDDLLSCLIATLTSACDDEPLPRGDRRKSVVDKACELLLSRPDEPPSLLEVCKRVGTSPRKLGYCFQDVLDMSPARYVKTIRLNAVRRELSRIDGDATTVYDVAARWGFWHFGHFSEDYRKQFAELPSQTLRKSRGRGAAPALPAA
ncbi:helix-turn-helix domain-containing protein [Pseudorhodoferax sp.]|uniref:helix-turn-helix domain-containing protein n=1 Tax=Pseudorhodoferax sp. TaxID=1993553 RepID=UPI002DD68F8E|nr:helix-turn-helix domain-containing protein [Pseudorhodoferax sp.]